MDFEPWIALGQDVGVRVWAILSSPLAQRLYFIAATLLVLAGSIWAARLLLKRLQVPREFPRFRGRKPTREEALRERMSWYETFRANQSREAVIIVAGVLLFGYLVPTLILFSGSYWYGWASMGGVAFRGPTGPIATPSLRDVTLFCLTQLAKGSLADLMEVFGYSWGRLVVDPANKLLLCLLVAYRFIVGSWSVVFLVAAQRLVVVRATAKREVEKLREQLDAATNQH